MQNQVGWVRSLRASVRYFTAAGMSSKPRLLTANFVNLQIMTISQIPAQQNALGISLHPRDGLGSTAEYPFTQ